MFSIIVQKIITHLHKIMHTPPRAEQQSLKTVPPVVCRFWNLSSRYLSYVLILTDARDVDCLKN